MKKYLTVTASLVAGAALMLAAIPAVAATIDVNVGIPGVIVQPQPVYVQPQPVYVQPRPAYVLVEHENEWRERQVRAAAWRDNPTNHGQVVSAEVHARNDVRKSKREKHNKHHGEGKHGH
jgi:hypothetical protein